MKYPKDREEATDLIRKLMREFRIESVAWQLEQMLTDDIGLFFDGEDFVLSDASCGAIIAADSSLQRVIEKFDTWQASR